MLKLRIYESEIEEEIIKALVDENKKILIFNGDYYHDKIDERIEGFLYGLRYSDKNYELLKTKVIKPRSKMYSICGFNAM